eukprot:SAG11_NODE_5167_length_1641_cov_5.074578_1_plen_81_part_00
MHAHDLFNCAYRALCTSIRRLLSRCTETYARSTQRLQRTPKIPSESGMIAITDQFFRKTPALIAHNLVIELFRDLFPTVV